MKDTNGLPVRFDCDCDECESDLARLEAADQADEIKRLRAQVAELLELARNLDYDFYAVVGTGPYVQHEVLARYDEVEHPR